jgi:hypothetical protein
MRAMKLALIALVFNDDHANTVMNTDACRIESKDRDMKVTSRAVNRRNVPESLDGKVFLQAFNHALQPGRGGVTPPLH